MKLVKSIVYITKPQFFKSVKTIRTGNGPNFFLKDFYMEHGIYHETSCIGTPKKNDIVERKHQRLLGVARALLFQPHLPSIFRPMLYLTPFSQQTGLLQKN